MEILMLALEQFETKDKDLKDLVSKVLERLKDDVEESGLVFSSVMEDMLDELEEYMNDNYPDEETEEEDEEDIDEDELRDLGGEDED